MYHADFSRQWLRRTQVLVDLKQNSQSSLETNLGSKNVNCDSQINQAGDFLLRTARLAHEFATRAGSCCRCHCCNMQLAASADRAISTYSEFAKKNNNNEYNTSWDDMLISWSDTYSYCKPLSIMFICLHWRLGFHLHVVRRSAVYRPNECRVDLYPHKHRSNINPAKQSVFVM